jgi:hypothetical protein
MLLTLVGLIGAERKRERESIVIWWNEIVVD